MKKNYIKLVVAMEILGIAIQGLAFYDARRADTISIERPKATEKAEDIRLRVNGAKEESEIVLSVEAKRPTEDEIKELFEKAKSEIDESFLGENRSADQVWRRLSFDGEYADGLVEASWDFEPRGIVDGAGIVFAESAQLLARHISARIHEERGLAAALERELAELEDV